MNYKYNEFEPEEFEHYNKKYSSTFTYLSELPHNTKFHVENGYWEGKVIHKDDGIYIQTTLEDEMYHNGNCQFKINEKYSAWITIIE